MATATVMTAIAGKAREAVERALFRLDIGFGLAQPVFRNRRIDRRQLR